MSRSEAHGRPTCSQCTDALKRKRGCRRPGYDYPPAENPAPFSSPMLQGERDRIMRECPVGYILRVAMHVYDTLDVCAAMENAGPSEMKSQPQYVQHAFRLYVSEVNRHERTASSNASLNSDAQHAARVLKGRG